MVHRYPKRWRRVHDLANVLDNSTAMRRGSGMTPTDSDEARADLMALPGFGEMKVKALARSSQSTSGHGRGRVVPWHPTLGDVTRPKPWPITKRPSGSQGGVGEGRPPSPAS